MINRREFLKRGSVAAAAFAAGGPLQAQRTARSAGGRLVLPINRGWRFSPQRQEGAAGRGFDDSRWERVTIPHTNRRVPWHSFNDKDYEFVSTYRRRFRLPASTRGRHVFVDFD